MAAKAPAGPDNFTSYYSPFQVRTAIKTRISYFFISETGHHDKKPRQATVRTIASPDIIRHMIKKKNVRFFLKM